MKEGRKGREDRWKEEKTGRKEGRKEKKTGRKKGRKDRRKEEEEGNWAGLDLLAGRVWPTGLMFDTPGLN